MELCPTLWCNESHPYTTTIYLQFRGCEVHGVRHHAARREQPRLVRVRVRGWGRAKVRLKVRG